MKNEKLEKNRTKFLDELKRTASQAANIEEISYKLGFEDTATFEAFLKEDKEANSIWHQARLDCWIKAKAAIVEAAGRGNAKAMEVLDRLLKEEEEEGSTLSENVTITQLAKLTGKSGQTVHNWIKLGLPREVDKTFNLPKFFNWFDKYKLELGKKSVKKVKSSGALQELKAKKLELELQRERGGLLDRNEVLAGLIARHQRFLQFYNRLTDVATQIEGKPLKQIVEALEKFFAKLIETQKDEFVELRLPTKIRNQFLKLLKMLEGDK